MLATVLSMLGLAGGVGYSAISSKKQFSRQLALQQQAQAWAEYMSSTAHQREVADLRKAGMNPILTATGGNGASWSSPSAGHAEQGSSPDFGQVADALNTAASVDVAAKNADTQAASVKVAEKNADTQAFAQASQAAVNQSVINLNKANTALAEAKAAKEGALTPAYNASFNVLDRAVKSFDLLYDKNTWKGIFGSNSAKGSRGHGGHGGHGSGPIPIIEVRKSPGKKSSGPLRMSWDKGKTWYTKTEKGWQKNER